MRDAYLVCVGINLMNIVVAMATGTAVAALLSSAVLAFCAFMAWSK